MTLVKDPLSTNHIFDYITYPFQTPQHHLTVTTKMSNSVLIHLNNVAIDYLNVGEILKAQKILTQAFHDSIRQSHRNHNLETRNKNLGLEYLLQDCFHPLQRGLNGCDTLVTSNSHLFLSLNFVRIETSHLSPAVVDQLCTCALSWALGYK